MIFFKLNYPVNKIIIYDTIGNLVKIFEGENEPDFLYDISNLESGIYLISIIKKNNIKTLKLIKN